MNSEQYVKLVVPHAKWGFSSQTAMALYRIKTKYLRIVANFLKCFKTGEKK